MTKWEKWCRDEADTRCKRDFICKSYVDCEHCPLDRPIDCRDMRHVKKWLESEVEK